jgi:hypothetical protein
LDRSVTSKTVESKVYDLRGVGSFAHPVQD